MASQFSVEPGWRVALRHLEEKERDLELSRRADEVRHSGLIDLENSLRLAQTKLAMCLVLLDAMAGTEDGEVHHRLFVGASRRARDAVGILERLRDLNVSEDQKSLITEHPDHAEATRLLEQLVLEGGAVLLERVERDRARERSLREAVVHAVAKYADPDDRYAPLIDPVSPAGPLRRGLCRLLGALFPTHFGRIQGGPPYGIEEEEERLVVSERMRMPLSQAILYTESELLPELHRRLEDSPGDPVIQLRIQGLQRQLEQFRRTRFTPRSTPVVLEKGFYTEWITGYTLDGELLVNVALPVTYRSGTNLSRVQELAFGELVRRLAGRGVCRKLDEEYEHLRSLRSGVRGSTRFPSTRLNTERGFAALKREFPHLRALENRDEFGRLLQLAARGGRKALERGVRRLLSPRSAGAPLAPFLME